MAIQAAVIGNSGSGDWQQLKKNIFWLYSDPRITHMPVDAHTHRPKRIKGLFEIESIDLRAVRSGAEKQSGAFVAGLHPWWLDSMTDDEAKKLIFELAESESCLGIGETGLDKSIELPLAEQMRWLKLHLRWAAELHKPLVVLHVVRAFPEIRSALKEFSFDGVILIHDCAAPVAEMAELEKDSRLWFSYGSSLFRENSRGFDGFLNAPKDRILFETDDSGRSIEDIYKKGLVRIDNSQLLKNEDLFLKILGHTPP